MLRLLKHRLRPDQLRMVANNLKMGKVRLYLSHTFEVRLTPEDPVCDLASKLQVKVNDLARLLLGKRRADNQKERLTTAELLKKAEIPSINAIIAKEAAAVTWTAMRGGPLCMEYAAWSPDTRSRSAADGTMRLPPRTMLLMRSGIRLWNSIPAIRAAKTRSAVTTLVEKLDLLV